MKNYQKMKIKAMKGAWVASQ